MKASCIAGSLLWTVVIGTKPTPIASTTTCDRIFSATRVLMKFSQHDRRQCVEWLLELWRGFEYVDQPWTDAADEITMVR